MIQSIFSFFEKQSFGVCSYIGERWNISISKLRIFFIYVSFLAVGFPVIFYFLAAFVLDFRKYVRKKRFSFKDL